MVKLLICLFGGAAIAVTVLQLRQQRLALEYQNTELHGRIRSRQATLWNQQLQIAVGTAPNAISKTIGDQHLNLTPQAPLPPGRANWIDVRRD